MLVSPPHPQPFSPAVEKVDGGAFEREGGPGDPPYSPHPHCVPPEAGNDFFGAPLARVDLSATVDLDSAIRGWHEWPLFLRVEAILGTGTLPSLDERVRPRNLPLRKRRQRPHPKLPCSAFPLHDPFFATTQEAFLVVSLATRSTMHRF